MAYKRRKLGVINAAAPRRKFALPVMPMHGAKRLNAFATRFAQRKRARTVTTTKRRVRRFANRAITRDYAYKKSKLRGSRVSVTRLVPYRIDRCQGIKQENPDEDPTTHQPGFYVLDKPDVSTTAGNIQYPVAVLNMSYIANTSSATANCFYKLNIGDTGLVTFTDMTAQNAAAVTGTARWTPEYDVGVPQTAGMGARYAQHMWYDFRFKLYGCKSQDVSYDLYIVTFKDDALTPETTGWNALQTQNRYRFWQELVRPMIINTILPGAYNWRRDVNIIRSKRVTIKSEDTSDANRNPSSVDLRWNLKDGKIRYYAEQTTVFASDITLATPSWQYIRTGVDARNQDLPQKVSDRMYLIIRATDMETRGAAVSGLGDPSFDMCVRRMTRYYPLGMANI